MIFLASESEARRRLLTQLLGVRGFQSVSANIDERKIQQELVGPGRVSKSLARRLAQRLADEKALSVWSNLEPKVRASATVIGSDQLLWFQGAIVGKPGTRRRAIQFLHSATGRSATLVTALTVVSARLGVDGLPRPSKRRDLQSVDLRFAILTDRQIAEIVDFDRPFHCAGSFKIESRGIALFDQVVSDDPSGIQGLPLMRLRRALNHALNE